VAPYFHDFGFSDFERHDEFGAKNAAKMKYDGEWWRLVTPFLLHTGWPHVLGNLGIQLRAGITLEYLWGHFSWLIIYFGSGIFATLSSVALKPDSLSVGASGALSGLMGAWPVFLLATWDQVKDERERKKRDLILVIVLLSIAALIGFSFQPLIDWAAHIGGLVMGVFLAMTIFSCRMTNRLTGMFVGSIGFVLSCLFYFFTVFYILKVVEPEPSLSDI
jgi:rhomboid protease GluP